MTAEVIGRRAFADLAECQQRFDAWRVVYNTQRPHQALDLATPAARYRPSRRSFPQKLEPFDYGPGATVRRVDEGGWLSFGNRPVKLGPIVDGLRVVRSGLKKDERIVVNGLQRIRPNDLVTPVTVTMDGENSSPAKAAVTVASAK